MKKFKAVYTVWIDTCYEPSTCIGTFNREISAENLRTAVTVSEVSESDSLGKYGFSIPEDIAEIHCHDGDHLELAAVVPAELFAKMWFPATALLDKIADVE